MLLHFSLSTAKLLASDGPIHNRAYTHFVLLMLFIIVLPLSDASCTVVCGFFSQRLIFSNCSSQIEYFAIFTSTM